MATTVTTATMPKIPGQVTGFAPIAISQTLRVTANVSNASSRSQKTPSVTHLQMDGLAVRIIMVVVKTSNVLAIGIAHVAIQITRSAKNAKNVKMRNQLVLAMTT